MKKRPSSLYVHIPFCHNICSFCDFTKILYNKNYIKSYIDSLIKEIKSYDIKKLDTIYIGGGSPSALSLEEIKPLLEELKPLLNEDYEFTIECNPEDISLDLMKLYASYGINRLSIGVQSFSSKVIDSIDRHHDEKMVRNALDIAINEGISNLSIDLIYGLPNQDIEVIKKDLKILFSLPIKHFSSYSLTVNKGTKLYLKGFKEIEDDLSRSYYDLILKEARIHDFIRYEVSNFALEGYYSKHNLVYWNDEHYFGAGLGASGYIDENRYTNTRNINQYINEGPSPDITPLSEIDRFEEYLMLKLRTIWGFSLIEFKKLFSHRYQETLSKIEKLREQNLLVIDEDKVYCSDEGMMLLDLILIKLF